MLSMKLLRPLALAGVVTTLLSGCFDEVVYVDQNWTEENQYRALSYSTSQGSQLIPYDWYLHLQDAETGLPLKSHAVTERLGYLPAYNADLTTNPDKLPVGFVKDTDPSTGDWLGINCAACHTGQIIANGTAIRIDGAPGLGDYIGLMRTTKAAIDNTLGNESYFSDFAERLGVADIDALRSELSNSSDELAGIILRDGSAAHEGGYGRVDAATAIRNEIFVHDLGIESNFMTPSAPVSYPSLWDTPRFDKVQYPGYAENPFGRNVGQVLGVLGRLELKDPANFLESSVRRENLFYLEQWIAQLQSPQWPEQYLGDIDVAAAERGRALYHAADQNGYSCAGCHALADENGQYPMTPPEHNAFGMQFIKTPITPLSVVGTDPNVLANFYDPTPIQTAQLAGLFDGATEVPFPVALITLTRYSVGKLFYTDPELSPLEQAAYSGYRVYAPGYSQEPLVPGYLARPLAGSWATSPYLHNGSVPNLYELLLPAEQRSQEFYVGNQQFDTEKVGYQSEFSARAFKFDTTVSGNSNAGHEFSVGLSDAERYDLIEFLKTL